MKTSLLVSAAGCLLISRAALATLGADVSSVESDRASMKAATIATTATTASDLYTVHAMQTPSGTTIREFANAAGTVFAVSWRGPFPPDLRQTLGGYFQTYQTAPRAKHFGHAHDIVEQPGLVVHASGHVRSFIGNAYVPQLVPAGVSIDQLLQSNP